MTGKQMTGLASSLTFLKPSTWRPSVRVARSLWFEYAHLKTVARRSCIDAAENPVPWYTYPAIEYLKQLDFSGRSVFEYGSGNSTLFWASVAGRVVSVEDDEKWHAIVAPQLPAHCELVLETDVGAYGAVIQRYPEQFDVIVVDGAARGNTRLNCSRLALRQLREGGMIILDNSDWLPESARALRDGGLIQVDMTGFAPISAQTQTTSFFLHRAFNFTPRGSRQPLPGPGAPDRVWEYPAPTEEPRIEFGGEVFGAVRRDAPFSIASPGGARPFRLLVAGASQYGRDTAAILDVGRNRVLVAITDPTHGTSLEAELAPAMSMPWPEFVRFVNEHPKRRYLLQA
jgi:hypothetical protein